LRDALRDTTLRLTAEDRHYAEAVVALQAQLVRDMVRAGARVMVGTDRDIARPALAEELELLVGTGLTPAEALRAATVAPASYMGASDSLGAVAPGKLADLVLLDADPLRDIGSVARVHAVVFNGRLLGEPERRRLLLHQPTSGSKIQR
jgi:imidazolonepropionase-like amidohydrolase